MQKNDKIILCIPRMETSVTKESITKTFKNMNIGAIESIYESHSQTSPQYKRVLIYVKWNLSSTNTKTIYSRLENNQNIKIVHNMPWYWICVKYVKPKTSCLISPETLRLCNG